MDTGPLTIPAAATPLPAARRAPTLAEVAGALALHQPDVAASRQSPRRAAVAVILDDHPGGGTERVLFIRRAEHPMDPWSGHMAFPGGHQDPGDPSLLATAMRETLEEIGLDLAAGTLLGRLSDLSGGRLSAMHLTLSAFVFHSPRPAPLTLNREVAAALWVPLGFLADPANVSPYVYPPDPLARRFPSYQYQGHTIWGMTYRVVTDLMRLFDIRLPGEEPLTAVE